MRKICLALLSVAVLATVASAEFDGSKGKKITPYTPDAPVDIQADSFQSVSNGWVSASGNVVIRQKDVQLTADRVMINRETGEIAADGNVILIREGQVATRSDHVLFNYKSGDGLSNRLDMQSGAVRVISGPSTRDEHGFFLLHDALVTTCTNDPSCLHYAVTADEAEFQPGEYVQMHNALVRFQGFPIFYYPLFRRSLADHFGWRFEPGYETDLGAFLYTTYKTQLVDLGGEFHDTINSHTHLDYRTERGFAFGEDLSWKIGELYNDGSYGWIGGYWIRDDNPMDEDYDRETKHDIAEDNRYRFTLRHDTYFSPQDYLTIRTSYLSDSYVLPDFYEEEYKDYLQPESYASYSHIGEYISFGGNVNHRANKFYQNVNRVPELWFDTTLLELGETGLYYESQTAGGYLQYEYADYDNDLPVAESYDTFRFDSRHEITYPFKLDFLSIVPRTAYRGTYYSTTMDTRYEEYSPDGTNTATRTIYEDGDAKLRSIFEVGTEVSFKAYGFYDGPDGLLYRHVVEPYANWTYVPEPNVRPFELYYFDDIDSLDMGNYVKTGVRQTVQRKNDDKSIIKLFELDLYSIYYFEDANGESGMKYYGFDIVWLITDSIKVDADGRYSVDKEDFEYVDFWLGLWQGERFELAGECYYIPDDTTLFKGDIRCNLSDYWAVGLYARYDAEISRCEQVTGYLQYSLDCISFRFRTAYEPAFTRDDGTEREAKVKLGFYTWLRAFTPSRYERKLRDGYWDD